MDIRNPEFDLYAKASVEAVPKLIQRCILEGDLPSLETYLKRASTYHINFPDQRGNATLHTAVLTQNLGAVKLLLEYKASVRKPTMDGNTALHLACVKSGPNSEAIILELLAADPNIIDFCDRECARKTAEMLQRHSIARIVGASESSLHGAAAAAGGVGEGEGEGEGDGEAQSSEAMFLEASQSREGEGNKDDAYSTPLHVAVKSGNVMAVKHLLEAGASSSSTFIVSKKQANNASNGRMVFTKTILELAAELADSNHHHNSRDILGHLVDESKRSNGADNDENSRKRRLPTLATSTPVLHTSPEESVFFTTGGVSESGHVAYSDMMQHMWDEEGPQARRQAEYETAMLYYNAQSTDELLEAAAHVIHDD